MAKHCIVKGCKSANENGFPFPEDRPTVNTKWLAAIEKHQELSPTTNNESRLICPAHFLEADFLKNRGKGKPQISKKAIPSIFPEIKADDESDDEEEDGDSVEHVPNATKTLTVKKKPDPDDVEYLPSDNDEESDVEGASESDQAGDEEAESDGDGRLSDDDDNFEYINEDDNMRDESQNSESNADSSRNIETAHIFEPIKSDEEIDSDYEPVTIRVLSTLQENLTKKTESLKKDRATLQSMEEMIRNQANTIVKLEEELQALVKAEEEEAKHGQVEPALPTTTLTKRRQFPNSQSPKKHDFSNKDLQLFSISLYYFSPKVYSYLGSIMPYLPPKSVVVDWVKTGHATKIFPAGVLTKENFNLD